MAMIQNLKKYTYVFIFGIFLLSILGCQPATSESQLSESDVKNGSTAELFVKRKKNTLVGVLTDVRVLVNNNLIGTVANGEEKLFQIKPSKNGTTSIRFETNQTEIASTIGNILKDSTIRSGIVKDFKIKIKIKERLSFYCILEDKLLVEQYFPE